MTSPKHVDHGSVALTVPGTAEYLRLVRLAAADCGARADLSIEEVEDLRIAVDELAYLLIGDDPAGEALTLRYVASPGVVEIEGSCAAHGETVVMSELSRAIITAVVDEHDIVDDGETRRFRLLKRGVT